MRVLELSGGVATSYTGKLLADEGADVIKVEPLTGDTLRASSGRIGENSMMIQLRAGSTIVMSFFGL